MNQAINGIGLLHSLCDLRYKDECILCLSMCAWLQRYVLWPFYKCYGSVVPIWEAVYTDPCWQRCTSDVALVKLCGRASLEGTQVLKYDSIE